MRHPQDSASHVAVIGGGLAGCEAALQLALRGIPVKLYEMKPQKRPPAHHADTLAEIVCSNSFGNLQQTTASGLLKAELQLLNCQLIGAAMRLAVPAGNALAVDREQFSREITRLVDARPEITRITADVSQIPEDAACVIIATGPLTSPGLADTLKRLLNQEQLYFFDAAAPILTRDSINFDIAFYQNRYNKSAGEGQAGDEADEAGSYINCPLDKDRYLALRDFILSAEKTPIKDFEAQEKTTFFESCLPVEVLASRGVDTLRYGPMKPVGLVDPHTGKRPYAVVQLRRDNREGTLYNMVGFQTNLKWGAQKTMVQMIPGLENAEVVRYGVMHRNTYLNSPQVLMPTMQLRAHPRILVAGQLTGTEGYTESIASGLMASLTASRLLCGLEPVPLPPCTMMGALFQYITRPGVKDFQPINSNWGILPPLDTPPIRDKQARNTKLAQRALSQMQDFIAAHLSHHSQQQHQAPLSR